MTAVTDFQTMFNYLPDVTTPFPLLTSLDCRARSAKILHNLRLPSLRDLHLRQLASSDVELVCAMLQRSGCKLENLKLDCIGLSGRDVLNLCKVVPNLLKLSIDSVQSYENSKVLADELARSRSFLPALVRLHIDVYGNVKDSELEKFEKTLMATRPGLEFWWSEVESD